MRILERILSQVHSAGLRRRDRGLTLIETSVVLGILAVVVVYLGTMLLDSSERIRAKAASDRLAEVHEAATAYIKANYSRLVAVAPASPNALVVPITGTAGPAGVTGATSLQNGGFLPASFVNVNSYNQTHALLVRRLGANGLEALVTTNGGQVIPDAQLGRIASFRGAAGGFMASRPLSASDNGVVTGAYGGWRTDASTWGSVSRPTVGHLASTLAFDDGGMIADYLYRNDIGIPEANRMNTSIDLNSNDLNNVRTLNAQTANAQTVNAQTGNIQQVNADNVVAALDIWAKRNLTVDGSAMVGGQVNAGSVLSRSTIDAVGNINSGGSITGNSLVSRGNAQINGSLGVSGDANVNGNIVGRNVTAAETVTANSRLYSRGNAQVDGSLGVNGNAQVNGSLGVSGNAQVNGRVGANDVSSRRLDASAIVYGGGISDERSLASYLVKDITFVQALGYGTAYAQCPYGYKLMSCFGNWSNQTNKLGEGCYVNEVYGNYTAVYAGCIR